MSRDKITIAVPFFHEEENPLVITHENEERKMKWYATIERGPGGGFSSYYEFDLDVGFLKSILAYVSHANKAKLEIDK